MKTKRTIVLSLLTTALAFTGLAHAESTVTRAQLQAEAMEAIRTGEVVDYETGRKLNELFPLAYPKAPKAAQVTVVSKPARLQAGQAVQAKEIGNLEYDAITQRNAQALAHGQAKANALADTDGTDAGDSQLAGVTR